MKTLAKYHVFNHCVTGEKTFKNKLIGPGKLPGLSRNGPQHAFSCAWRLHLFASNCDWFIALFTSVIIGQSSSFGFDSKTLKWKPL